MSRRAPMAPGARLPVRGLVRLAVSCALLMAVAALTRVPLGEGIPEARLHLTLRSPDGRVEVCRERSAAELDALPPHMRRPEVCDTVAVPHRLVVAIDGRVRLDRRVEASGLLGKRPLVVDERLELPPGRVHLAVRFGPWESRVPAGAPPGTAEVLAAIPRHRLEATVDLEAGRVTVVHLDDPATGLELVEAEE